MQEPRQLFHANINGLKTHVSDVEAEIRILKEKPDLLVLKETKLDEADPAKIIGYKLVCRKDRTSHGGGIAVFASEGISEQVTLLDVQTKWERCWFLLHSDQGPFLFSCCYRPLKENLQGLTDLRDELVALRSMGVGVAIIGDMNVHQKSWLKFSDGDSPEGRLLQDICATEGLGQIVKEPTRNDNLLDIVATDVPSATATVGGKIQDHRYVLLKLNLSVQESVQVERTVWNFRGADWEHLNDLIADHNWDGLWAMTSGEAAAELTERILEFAEAAIGRRKIKERKSNHPWLNDHILKCIAAKRAAEGTSGEAEAAKTCSEAIPLARRR